MGYWLVERRLPFGLVLFHSLAPTRARKIWDLSWKQQEGSDFLRFCKALIRPPWHDLLSSLAFTLNTVVSEGSDVKMGPAGVMQGWAAASPKWLHHSHTLPFSSGASELKGERSSQGTQLRSDIPGLCRRYSCSFRPNTNSAELTEVSQHDGTHTALHLVYFVLFLSSSRSKNVAV